MPTTQEFSLGLPRGPTSHSVRYREPESRQLRPAPTVHCGTGVSRRRTGAGHSPWRSGTRRPRCAAGNALSVGKAALQRSSPLHGCSGRPWEESPVAPGRPQESGLCCTGGNASLKGQSQRTLALPRAVGTTNNTWVEMRLKGQSQRTWPSRVLWGPRITRAWKRVSKGKAGGPQLSRVLWDHRSLVPCVGRGV